MKYDGAVRPLAVVLSRHPLTRRHAAQALVASGLDVVCSDSWRLDPAESARARLLLVDLDVDASAPVSELIARAGETCPCVPIVAVAGVYAEERLLAALSEPQVASIIPKRGTGRTAIPPGVEALGNTAWPDEYAVYTLARRRFGLSLGPGGMLLAGADLHEIPVRSSAGRREAIAGLESLLCALTLRPDRCARVGLIAEELLMNALYDAPRDARGQARHRIGAGEVALLPSESVVLRYGCDSQMIVVSVSDSFGTLDRASVVDRLQRVGDPELSPADGPGGAGLGLIMAYASSSQLWFRVASGQATEVTAVLRIAGSGREIQQFGTAVHLEFEEHGEGGSG